MAPEILFLYLLLSSLDLSDAKVYEPEIRALLGTASQFCEEVVLKSRTVPNGISLRILPVIRRGAQSSLLLLRLDSRYRSQKVLEP